MKIIDVEAIVISGNWDWTIIKISTDEGVYGLGEASVTTAAHQLVSALAPLLIGENPLNIQRLFIKMMETTSGENSYAGIMIAAISGIEIALWDLAGKILDKPTYVLWGGVLRDDIRIYCDAGVGETPDPSAWRDRAAQVKEKNFTAYKFDIDIEQRMSLLQGRPPHIKRTNPWGQGITRGELIKKVELVEAVRYELGSEIDLAVDCHWAYSVPDSLQIASALESLNLMWLEDPLHPGNPGPLAYLRTKTKIPICTGENTYTRYDLLPYIEQAACDIIHPDIPKFGGLMESRKIAEIAEVFGLSFAAHSVCSPVGTIASANICATIRPFLALEFHAFDLEWWNDLVIFDGPVIQNGYIHLSDKPGLGIELNEDVCKAHLKVGETFFKQR